MCCAMVRDATERSVTAMRIICLSSREVDAIDHVGPSYPPASNESCPENEEYSACANPCNRCQKRKRCEFVCKPGCNCKEGYSRDFSGRCIPEVQCPSIGPSNPICLQEKDAGPCFASFLRYFYNNATGECEQFTYGGCRGNSNNFVTKEDCEAACGSSTQLCPENEVPSDCVVPCNDCQTKGKCNFLVCNKGCDCKEGYYRDFSGRCIPELQCPHIDPTPPPETCDEDEQFYECIPSCSNTCKAYTRNPPISCKQLCIRGCFCKKGLYQNDDGSCVPPEQCPNAPTPTTLPSEPICEQKKQVGPCKAAIPRYYYNKKTKKCEKFIYGGCNGNSNNFRTLEDCKATCGKKPPSDSICKQKKEAGPCKAAIPRYYYNKKTKKCEKFIYGGCNGNSNNFRTLEDCEAACGRGAGRCPKNEERSDCVIPCNDCQTRGRCNFLVCNEGCDCKKGYYRDFRGRCIPELQCPLVDQHPSGSICDQKKEVGPCRASFKRYYYNKKAKKCEKFTYGGCKGNSNNFLTLEDCEAACGRGAGKCPKNEERSDCVIPCNDCQTRGRCNFLVCNEGCDCKKGYYRDFRGRCIPELQCPLVDPTPPPPEICDEDEQYYACIPSCSRTCKGLTRNPPIFCNQLCISGCFCKEGLYQNDDGSCVPPEQCPNAPTPTTLPSESPQKCGPDELYYPNCAPSCTGTCEAYNNPGIYHCPLCKGGCWCKQGLVKRSDGKCVSPSQCSVPPTNSPTKKCGKNEQYYECVPQCHNTCDTYNDTTIACKFPCKPGCFCKEGMVKDNNGKCVKISKCSAKHPSGSICDQKKEVGPCRASFKRYYYNKKAKKCEKFTYGGCKGNSNNFRTLEDCEAACGRGVDFLRALKTDFPSTLVSSLLRFSMAVSLIFLIVSG
ncbi:tissue factor pathway inhibitor [Trichonephila clavipes]|nr:tissue factor pathway inhibitor [Trichonephila clavipes]